MADLPKGAKVFNVIRANSTEVFMNTVPSATKDNIQVIKNILFNDSYQPMLNEFVTNLINRIGLTIIRNKSYNNPLSLFKKGSVPLGTDIQDIYENPAEAEQYEYSNTAMAKLLTITDPDTHVAYYRRNRQDLYTKTIAREGLQGAFVSWEEFENYIAGITNSLYSGNYIDEFKYTKQLIDGAYDSGKVIQKEVTKPTNESTAKAFLKQLRALYDNMTFPSTEYNAYSKFSGAKGTITTWTDAERICLIVRADVMAEVDVEALASAFNIDKANFIGRVIKVDKFENDEILGVVCDESWLQIYDNIFRFDEFYNARTMSWNEYLHAWGTYAICPFANAVMLVTDESVPVTAISGSDQTVVAEASKTVTFTFTPNNATSQTVFTSSDEAVFTVEADDTDANKCSITGVAVGTADLTITADNGVSKTVEVTVTAE